MDIQIGSKVRSFDFDYHRDITGEEAFYVEGEVVAIREWAGCERYVVLIEKQVFAGKEEDSHVGTLTHPPINGLLNIVTGGKTNGVELL